MSTKAFKDFSVKPVEHGFAGEKININRVLNREIMIHDYKVRDSKFQKDGQDKCLHLQISIGDTKHVLFTGSMVLLETIIQIPKEQLPFTTTIVNDNKRYEFT